MRKFIASACVILLLDQISKALIRSQMELREMIPLLGDLLRLRYVHNAGAAFGLFQGSRMLFIIISLISIAVVLYLIISGRYQFRGSRTAFGMILGGALGNLIDRVWMKEVVDFLDMGIGSHRWPTYNVADIGVTLGVLYLAATFLTTEREHGAQLPKPEQDDV